MKCVLCGKELTEVGLATPLCQPCAIKNTIAGVSPIPLVGDPHPFPKFKAGEVVTGKKFTVYTQWLTDPIDIILFGKEQKKLPASISDCFKGADDPFRL